MKSVLIVLIGFLLLVSPFISSSRPPAGPILRVEHINKSNGGTEVELQPMLSPRFSAFVEEGELKQGEVIRCEPKSRYVGTDEKGNKHHIIVLQCGDKVLLLREVQF